MPFLSCRSRAHRHLPSFPTRRSSDLDILFDAGGFVDPADKARIEADLGLDRSLPVQYARWIGGLLTGDLGISYQTERPALQEIAPRIPITARLAGLAMAFAILLGVPLGVISAVKPNTR